MSEPEEEGWFRIQIGSLDQRIFLSETPSILCGWQELIARVNKVLAPQNNIVIAWPLPRQSPMHSL
jgi:hypothetical protein